MNAALNLASTDEDERLAAVRHALHSLDIAAEVGAAALVVHLGSVGTGALPGQAELWRMFDAGDVETDEFEHARERLIAARRAQAGPWLEAVRKSLADLLQAAAPHGIVIGLESRLNYHEIPLPEECLSLLQGIPPEQAGYWHDVGHVEVLARLGLVDLGSWFSLLGDQTVGAHVHDVTGLVDHRAPGAGDVEWPYLVDGLSHLDWLTLEINQHQPDDQVQRTPEFLRGVGFA